MNHNIHTASFTSRYSNILKILWTTDPGEICSILLESRTEFGTTNWQMILTVGEEVGEPEVLLLYYYSKPMLPVLDWNLLVPPGCLVWNNLKLTWPSTIWSATCKGSTFPFKINNYLRIGITSILCWLSQEIWIIIVHVMDAQGGFLLALIVCHCLRVLRWGYTSRPLFFVFSFLPLLWS